MNCACSTNGKRTAYRILVKPEGKRPILRPRRRWGIILKWILEIGWGGMDCIDPAQDREVESPSEYGTEPLGCIKWETAQLAASREWLTSAKICFVKVFKYNVQMRILVNSTTMNYNVLLT
jgi:hypothetical protein